MQDSAVAVDRAVERSRAADVDREGEAAECITWNLGGRVPLQVDLYSDDGELVLSHGVSNISLDCIDDAETRERVGRLARVLLDILENHS